MALVTNARCRLCAKTFRFGGGALLIGGDPDQEQKRAVSQLMDHFTKIHPENMRHSQYQGAEYSGLIALTHFDFDDEKLVQQRDQLRWKIHQLTRRAQITDERIAERANALAAQYAADSRADNPPAPALADRIAALLQEMRDVLLEAGRHQFKDQPPPVADRVPIEPDPPAPTGPTYDKTTGKRL